MTRVVAIIAALALWLAGCASDSPVAVRVGDATITQASVTHWMTILSPAGKEKALDFLISSAWLAGEARELALGITQSDVEAHFKAKVASAYPGGTHELHEYLNASHQSEADAKLGVERELITAAIEHKLAAAEPAITPAQVAAYYAGHKQRFSVPEMRTLQITNRKSTAQGQQLRREVAAGMSFASMSQSTVVDRPAKLGEGGVQPIDSREKAPLERAMFSAKVGVLTGPIKFRVDYFVFEVTRIAPPPTSLSPQ